MGVDLYKIEIVFTEEVRNVLSVLKAMKKNGFTLDQVDDDGYSLQYESPNIITDECKNDFYTNGVIAISSHLKE
ncbi:MAG: hypothetical protein ABFD50_04580 [Smithella sp.]